MACECHWFPQKYGKRWLLADFGSSLVVGGGRGYGGRKRTQRHATFGRYIAPELRKQSESMPVEFSRKSDIWAIGCVIYELATKGRDRLRYDCAGSELVSPNYCDENLTRKTY